MFGCYIKEKKKIKMGERCELWGGNERKKWNGWRDVCGGGEEKRKVRGVRGWWGKKKERKKSGVYVYGGKKGGGKERRKKFWKGKTKLVLFVCLLCFVQSVELWKFISRMSMIFFYHKWFVYISIAHTIHNSLYFFITLFKFYKNVCKEICTNHDNVILYFFITLLILYW